MSAPTLKVLIAGGGIAGSSLAFWLDKTKLDIHITVIERSPTPRVTGQAVDVRGRAVKVIQRMGLEEAILAKNTTETGTAFVDSQGKIIAQFDADGDKSATSEFEILRADLAKIFHDTTKDRSNIEYIYGESIDSLNQDGKGVHVTFTGGKPAATFELVVGADGLGSKTRSLAFDKSIAANPYNPLGMYVAYFSIPSRPDDTKLWRWYTAPKGRSVMIRPHQNPSTVGAYLSVTMPSRAAKDPDMVEAMEKGHGEVKKLLREYFKDAGWQANRVLEGMETAKDFYIAAWDQVKIPKWTNGHVVLVCRPYLIRSCSQSLRWAWRYNFMLSHGMLHPKIESSSFLFYLIVTNFGAASLQIGDAGYATPGAGTSHAIEGAYILAGELSKVGTPDEIPAALGRYENILRPLVEPNQQLPPGAPQILNPQTGWGISVLNTLLWGVYKTSAHKLFGGFSGVPTAGKDSELPDYDWVNI